LQIIVQEGEANISLTAPVQAPDGSLRTSTVNTVVGPVKVFYRDYEVIRIEARDGALELLPQIIGAIAWIEKRQRYQLKLGG
jgi:hypothetical protein